MRTSRRNFLRRSFIAGAGLSTVLNVKSSYASHYRNICLNNNISASGDPDAFKISIFSKHLQWLDYKGMAKALAETGFDGADLSVRPGGHVLPENVERDLPEAAESLDREGKKIYMITTSIADADDPLTEKIIKTAGSLGIKHYRMGYGHYDNTKSVEENIFSMQVRLEKLALLNEKYSISGEYQNHSGVAGAGIYFGGAIWDIAAVLKKVNSAWLGSQYDIYHATVEGANTWPVAFRLISPYIRSADIKDFKWIEKEGKTRSEPVPLGEGMVDFKKYFSLLKSYNIKIPLSIHYEYPLGGAEHGLNKLTIKREEVLSAMKKDLGTLKTLLADAGLITE